MEPHDDATWLAFRYSAGEMTPEEADAFEKRLEMDQSAREELSRVVGLTSALARAVPAAIQRRTSNAVRLAGRAIRAAGWMAAGAAAAALVFWLAGPSSQAPDQPSPRGLNGNAIAAGAHPNADPVAWPQRAADDWLAQFERFRTEPALRLQDPDQPTPPPRWLLTASSVSNRGDNK